MLKQVCTSFLCCNVIGAYSLELLKKFYGHHHTQAILCMLQQANAWLPRSRRTVTACLREPLPGVHMLTGNSCVMQNGVETLVPTGPYNIAFSRTPAEVLAIVSLGSASTPGGFFPAGVNGAIQG
jgi:hypothetical protein